MLKTNKPRFLFGIVVFGGLISCSLENITNTDVTGGSTPSFEQAKEALRSAAKQDREKYKDLSFEEFEAKVYREPFEGGKYIVNGDTPIVNKKRLREFFEAQVQKDPELQPTGFMAELVVHQVGGLDAVWNSSTKRQLTYCVSNDFGDRHSRVVADMEAAGGAWEAGSDIDFIHVAQQDGNCTADNQNVLFDVRPVDVNGQYLARAFFPNESRVNRNVLIDESSFQIDPNGNLQLVGILRHELGHTLGFRHEHTRPTSGACFEDENWRPLTDYDPFSTMHYPQCNGQGDWTLSLTHQDKNGSACLYGAAPEFTIDPEVCTGSGEDGGSGAPGTPQTQTFTQQNVSTDEEKRYGPFPVASGALFEAKMQNDGSPGDPDLYVRFGNEPQTTLYDCRPYWVGVDETCSVDVPGDEDEAFVMVRGYSAGGYNLTVTYTPPAG